MVDNTILKIIRQYLVALPRYGIHPQKAILYGSFVNGNSHEWSDIDLIVIAPEFDRECSIDLEKKLWIATEASDNRIEPIPCGEREWEENQSRPILEIAREEGIVITI